MEITTQQQGKVIIVGISGRFDAAQVTTARNSLSEALKQTPQVVVDLGNVGFMDSAALAVLVQGMKHARQKDGDLRVCNLQQPVRVIFELTRLDKAFKLFANQDEAVTSFDNAQ